MHPSRNAPTRRHLLAATAALAGSGIPVRPAAADPLPGRIGVVSPRPKLTAFYDSRLAAGSGEFETWAGQVQTQALRAPGLKAMAFNVVDKTRTKGSPYDAAMELEFSGPAALARYQAAAQPVTPPAMTLVTTAVTIRAPDHRKGKAGAKRMGLVGRGEGWTQEHFFGDWRDIHAIDVDKQPGLTGYLLNMAPEAAQTGADWDGYAELWWPDWDVYDAATKVRLQQAGDSNFFAKRLLLLVQETRYVALG